MPILKQLELCQPRLLPYAQSALILMPPEGTAFLSHPELVIPLMAINVKSNDRIFYYPVSTEMLDQHEALRLKAKRFELMPLKTELGNTQFIMTNLESTDDWSLSKLGLRSIAYPVKAERTDKSFVFTEAVASIERIKSLEEVADQLQLCFDGAIIDSEIHPEFKRLLEPDNGMVAGTKNMQSLKPAAEEVSPDESDKPHQDARAQPSPIAEKKPIDLSDVGLDEFFAEFGSDPFN